MLWTHPKHWKWKWLGLQVGLPLLGPIVLSLIIAVGVKTLQPDLPLSRDVIVDVTPWALIFFTMALLGGGIHDYWSAGARLPAAMRPPVAVIIFLFVVGAAVLIYVSLIVFSDSSIPAVPASLDRVFGWQRLSCWELRSWYATRQRKGDGHGFGAKRDFGGCRDRWRRLGRGDCCHCHINCGTFADLGSGSWRNCRCLGWGGYL